MADAVAHRCAALAFSSSRLFALRGRTRSPESASRARARRNFLIRVIDSDARLNRVGRFLVVPYCSLSLNRICFGELAGSCRWKKSNNAKDRNAAFRNAPEKCVLLLLKSRILEW